MAASEPASEEEFSPTERAYFRGYVAGLKAGNRVGYADGWNDAAGVLLAACPPRDTTDLPIITHHPPSFKGDLNARKDSRGPG